MNKTQNKTGLLSGVTATVAALVVGVLSSGTANAQAQNVYGVSRANAVYGIPPSANTARALSDRPGVIEGLLDGFYASLGVAINWTDNVLRVPSPNEESDTYTAFTPRLGYQTNLGRHRALIEYYGYGEKYQDFTSLDSTDHRIRGAIDFDITDKFDAGIYAGWADVNERRGTSGSQVLQIEPNEVEITEYGADLRYGTNAARHMQVRFGGGVEDWRYQNNDQQFRDRDTNGVFGEIHYNVSDRTSVFLLGTYREFEYVNANATASDSEETTAQVGAEWQVTAKTRGRISAGRRDKDFKDPTVEDADTTTYSARIRWQPRSYTGVSLYGSRRFEETTSALDNFYVSTLWGVALDHALNSRWNGNAYLNYIDDDFDSGRQDEYYDFGLGVNYVFRNWMSLGARYQYIKRDSNIAVNNYKENIIGLTLQLSYQQQ